ncbi:ribokinase [Caballeronia sp. LZ043]|uniref:ribokinase n=1 Tax=Caballeronia sp. LZ043 TaxID=3038569 RepID=UPI00286BC0E2|nr:ribokinase [Caballeronia sp. LZ043]
MKITVVGYGNVGAAMVKQLKAAGHDVQVTGRELEGAEKVAQQFGATSASLAAAAKDAELVGARSGKRRHARQLPHRRGSGTARLMHAKTNVTAAGQPGRVLVIGSINTDFVARTRRLPQAGETELSHAFETVPGGKGANQAIAAACMGARVAMIGCAGRDEFGVQRVRELAAEGIDCAGIEVSETHPTGIAMITVSETGENSIVVASGSNAALSPASVLAQTDRFRACDVVVCQLETPPDTVHAALAIARRLGKITVLNPGPATQPLPRHWMPLIDYLVPNESEASILADGLPSAEDAALALHRAGARHVIVTLGARGVHVIGDAVEGAHHPARPVRAVDTTAAGDTFVGVLATQLATGCTLDDAMAHAQIAASVRVQHHGAQPSIPRREALPIFDSVR